MNDTSTPADSPLGKLSVYGDSYDPSLLFSMPRAEKRAELGLSGTLPFFGMDVWNAYELSWLNQRGKPQVAIASLLVPAETPNMVESKSVKLYLNSLNQTRIDSQEALVELLQTDLSAAVGAEIHIRLVSSKDFGKQVMGEFDGLLLDRLDIAVDRYEPDPSLLRAATEQSPVEETLVSHLLRSNCPVTNQPDWASIQIRYSGPAIDQEGLLKYLIGFRQHQEFHEHCVERVFMDIQRQCQPSKLMVSARYTRRGGIDINPWRANFPLSGMPSNARHARQ
ncbi:MAG: NADPH-dependent 7-cyano-7-deazaguanine reductase QueF [Betaproteobacteria bacterium]|nr:NADPH-dependent 7-cyano-7-deazaguanine reductase QueF [Betaproteobacteria bacterium]